jgi:hypothetical protein
VVGRCTSRAALAGGSASRWLVAAVLLVLTVSVGSPASAAGLPARPPQVLGAAGPGLQVPTTTATPTPSATVTVTPAVTLTATPTPSPAPSQAPSPTPKVTPSPTSTPKPPLPRPTSFPAYWEVASDGGIFSFGGTPFYGSMGGSHLNKPVVGLASPDGKGYWEVASDGGIFSFGDAPFYGSMGGRHLNKPIVGIAATPDGRGYWEVASDGGIFSFGDAGFYGSMGGSHLNQPIVAIAATADGHGYWEVASDGGIFSFGDAGFYGSMGGTPLNKPIVSLVPASLSSGYVEVAADGGTFVFGATPFYGSLGGIPIKRPIVAAAVDPGGAGYWFTDSGGEVFAFGQASYYGSAPSPLAAPIVGMAEGTGSGAFVGASYPSGSYGYDVSIYQCQQFPTGLHDIGIVQVDGVSSGATNPCLGQQATWAGAGLNLYTFLTNVPVGNQGPVTAPCAGEAECYAVGYNAGIKAFQDAQAAGVPTSVPWWLDVEGPGSYWTPNPDYNAQTIMGAINALRATEGIPSVGIYASPAVWNEIVGAYQPPVPYWMADWVATSPTDPAGPTACAAAATWQQNEQLPTGPVQIVQYSDSVNATGSFQGFDGDYAC